MKACFIVEFVTYMFLTAEYAGRRQINGCLRILDWVFKITQEKVSDTASSCKFI